MPTSLVTGLIGHVAGKALEHFEAKKNEKSEAMVGAAAATSETDEESPNATTSKRPTIIDFIAKFKTKRSVDAHKVDWGCSSKLSLAEVIGEHKVDTNMDKKVEEPVASEHELEEAASGGPNERAKRSTFSFETADDDDDTTETSCPCPPKTPRLSEMR